MRSGCVRPTAKYAFQSQQEGDLRIKITRNRTNSLVGEQLSRHRDLGHLTRDTVRVSRTALGVEGDDSFGPTSQVGDDEADARVQLARVPLDLATTRSGFFQLCAR